MTNGRNGPFAKDFSPKDGFELEIGGVQTHAGSVSYHFACGPETAPLKLVILGDRLSRGKGDHLAQADFQLHFDGHIAVGTGAIGAGLQNSEPNSAGGTRERELDGVGLQS